eukprot:CAMPEP_0174993418 /NCGR_PEP_ID=MMETSP0004_2-20121128/23062_1 /TAXON_ID=420556 /ORGANISM="Ochromonas sp., Strain CCMP1393" /LENGTH=275 /DNA_ID=CAMNT_0016247527 /DNA_START=133 /DNA_END=960 /DNA_ORIENTATION=+
MIMAHDAASGEIIEERDRVVMDWTRTQSVGLVGQLDCGSRAFDYRPHLQHGVLFAHHGPVVVHKTMKSSILDIMGWCSKNPEELVVLYVTSCDGDDGCMDQAKQLLEEMNVYTVSDCDDLKTLTYGKAKELGRLSDGGSLVAVVECTNGNYDSTLNCYGKSFVCYDSWPENTTYIPWEAMANYMISVTASDPTTSESNPSPYLWMAQAHWQSDTYSVVAGTLHNSSLLEDNRRSKINKWVEDSIYRGDFKYLNMLELNNVCENGPAVLEALRAMY